VLQAYNPIYLGGRGKRLKTADFITYTYKEGCGPGPKLSPVTGKASKTLSPNEILNKVCGRGGLEVWFK
jgi:hypothetical protein